MCNGMSRDLLCVFVFKVQASNPEQFRDGVKNFVRDDLRGHVLPAKIESDKPVV
jgi:hypothetical protein